MALFYVVCLFLLIVAGKGVRKVCTKLTIAVDVCVDN